MVASSKIKEIKEGKLDVQEVEEALRKVWTNYECPFSGHQSWTIVDELVKLTPYETSFTVSNEHRMVVSNVYPAVMLVCNGCGYMALFSAVALGLIEKYDVEAIYRSRPADQ